MYELCKVFGIKLVGIGLVVLLILVSRFGLR